MSQGPQFVYQDFQLVEHELLSGEPVFLVPRDSNLKVCNPNEAKLFEAYSYTHIQTDPQFMFPCDVELWDQYVLCLSNQRMCRAMIALGITAELMQKNGIGYFTRYETMDLRWENTVVRS